MEMISCFLACVCQSYKRSWRSPARSAPPVSPNLYTIYKPDKIPVYNDIYRSLFHAVYTGPWTGIQDGLIYLPHSIYPGSIKYSFASGISMSVTPLSKLAILANEPVIKFLILGCRCSPGEISCHITVYDLIPLTAFVIINVFCVADASKHLMCIVVCKGEVPVFSNSL